jgi:SWI/SNF-related matrix-associated actin-dependent regulator 1 of chromatin subfamily A
MTGGIVRCCALALALGTCTQALAARVVDPASARQAISIPAVAAQDAELAALAADGRATLLASRLEVIAHDAALADVAQEWLLDRGLHRLAQVAPTREARASVARLALRAPTVYTRVDPDHGDRATPLYDAGATARFVLRQWDRIAARDAAARDLAAGSARAVERYAARAVIDPADPVPAGIADAFRAAPAAQLAAQRAALTTALGQGRRVDALALVLAERGADRELFDLLVDFADEPTALAAVAAAPRVLDAPSALSSLERASRRADIASAAVLEVGRLAAHDPAARRFLFDALADRGIAPAAASALARLADPAVAGELGRRLAAAQTDEERRVLALALKLDASPAARAELARFARAGAGSPDLQSKVRRWLEH